MASHNTSSPEMSRPLNMAELWNEALSDENFRFEIKADSVAVNLVRAIAEQNFTQAQIAQSAGMSASRISKILHSGSNLTLKTIHDISTAIGLDFDVVFRRPGQQCAPQPWEITPLLENAMIACRNIERLQSDAEENLQKTAAMLETAKEVSRQVIVRANASRRPRNASAALNSTAPRQLAA